MKLLPLLLLIISFHTYGIYEFFGQQADLLVYATDKQSQDLIESILTKVNYNYHLIDRLDNFDDDKLYILSGDIQNLHISVFPQHYIVYQTTNVPTMVGDYLNILGRAVAVWDVSWSNIHRYKGSVNHWYYLPNSDYEFLDPVLLSCLLPLNALPTYKELLAHSNVKNTDFSSHLPVLFCHCFLQNPMIFVESGIRWGDGSTIALGKITHLLKNSCLIGLDIDNCARHYAHIPRAYFYQMDDVAFPAYFKTLPFAKDRVDFVFIDTSHQYEHTLQEIDAFATILTDTGTIAFHDSNVAVEHPVRLNGTACGSGLGNPKGVTDGLKTYFNIEFDEGRYLNIDVEKDGYLWNIVNYPYCYGFAVAKRIKRIE